MGNIEDKSNYILVFLPILLFLTVPLRAAVKRYNNAFPRNVLVVLLGVVIGAIWAICSYSFRVYWFLVKSSSRDVLLAFIPIFMVSSLHHINYPMFLKYLPQVLIITLIGAVLGPLMIGVIITYVLHTNWTFLEGVFAALVIMPIEPLHVVLMLKSLARYKQLETVLDSEAVILLVPMVYLFKMTHILINESNVNMGYFLVTFTLQKFGLGLICGAIAGKLQSLFLCLFYNQPIHAVMISICSTFITYYVGECVLNCSSELMLLIATLLVLADKHKLNTEVENCLRIFWATLHYFAETGTLMMVSIVVSVYVTQLFDGEYIFGVVILYLSGNLSRILRFLIISPFVKRMAYGFKMKYIIVWSLSDIKGTISLNWLLFLLAHQPSQNVRSFALEVLFYTILSLFLNCSFMTLLLRFLGLKDITETQMVNMNLCLIELNQKRSCLMQSLKCNRYFASVNWNWVEEKSILMHPYVKPGHPNPFEDYENDGCSDCEKDVPFDINEREISDLMKLNEMQILKAKKIEILNQCDQGIIEKDCLLKIMHQLENMIECNQDRHNFNLQQYLHPNKYILHFRKMIVYFSKMPIATPPLHPFRRLCFYILMHHAYDYIIYGISIGNAIFVLWNVHQCCFTWMHKYHLGIWFFYCFDFLMKMIGLSHKRFLTSAVKPYFRRKWNIIDFALLILGIIPLSNGPTFDFKWFIYYILPGYRPIAIIRLFFVFTLIHTLSPQILDHLDHRINCSACSGYEMGSALIKCNDVILSYLNYIIDLKMIRDVYRKEIIEDRTDLIQQLAVTQREKPFIPVTVKTKQAIRIALTAMQQGPSSMDPIEYHYISGAINKKLKQLRNLKFVKASPPRIIFRAVPWMEDDEQLIEYLFDKVKLVSWDAEDSVQEEGHVSTGVYILVIGMLQLSYKPKAESLYNEKYAKRGLLPIMDYLNTLEFDKPIEDMLMSGDTFGEFSCLTGYAYNASIVAINPSKAYFLPTDVIHKACEVFNNPVSGLEARIWKSCCIGVAVALMMQVPAYRSFTQEQIKTKLSMAFMPNLRCYKVFAINDLIDDVILVLGCVEDYDTGEVYKAPVVIARTVQKLVLSGGFSAEGDEAVQARLMIVPSELATGVQIMEQEEIIGEFVSQISSGCLMHTYELNIKRKDERKESWEQVEVDTVASSCASYDWSDDKFIINLDTVQDSTESSVLNPVRPQKSDYSKTIQNFDALSVSNK